MLMRVAMLATALAIGAFSVFHGANPSVAAASEAAPLPLAAARVAGGPPTVNGVYTFGDCEGEGGCGYKNWRVIQPTPLRAETLQTARVIATLAAGEWVHVEQIETRLVPRRGIVRANTPNFRAGEIVYALENEGEGYVNMWRRGAYVSVGSDDPVKIDWQKTVTPPHDCGVARNLGAGQPREPSGRLGAR